MEMTEEIWRYLRIDRLYADYCACLDEDRLEDWPELFLDDGVYKMVSRENYSQGFQIPLLLLDSKNMLRDRVYSLRNANIFQAHRYRHAISGVRITAHSNACLEVSSSYIGVQTLSGDLDATMAFTTLSIFNTLRLPLVQLPKALRALAWA